MAAEDNEILAKELEKDILEQEEEILPEDLLEEAKTIEFWDFLNKIPVNDRRTFCRLLDIEDGCRGWENFLAEMGLTKWQDRVYCKKYPGQSGPTERGLELLMDTGAIKRGNVGSVLELLRDMGRYDILTNVKWSSLLDMCKQLEGMEVVNFKPNINFKEIRPSPVIEDDEPLKIEKRNITVFLFYAPDASEDALFVADRFRQKWNFGVLIVSEPLIQAQLISDPSNTIHKWFLEADFIVPILSPQLLRQIQNHESSNTSLFNRHIYTLLQHQFVFDYGSKNKRCRPLCSKKFCTEVQRNPVMNANVLLKLFTDTTEQGIDQQATLFPILVKR